MTTGEQFFHGFCAFITLEWFGVDEFNAVKILCQVAVTVTTIWMMVKKKDKK